MTIPWCWRKVPGKVRPAPHAMFDYATSAITCSLVASCEGIAALDKAYAIADVPVNLQSRCRALVSSAVEYRIPFSEDFPDILHSEGNPLPSRRVACCPGFSRQRLRRR